MRKFYRTIGAHLSSFSMGMGVAAFAISVFLVRPDIVMAAAVALSCLGYVVICANRSD